MSEVRGLGREALLYAVATLITGATGFASIYIFSRLLIPSEYGYYYLVLSIVDITSSLATTWINLTLVRFFPSLSPHDKPVFFGRLLAANLAVAVVLVLLAFLAMPLVGLAGLSWWLPLIVLLVVVPQSWLGFVQNLFRAQRRPQEWLLTSAAMALGRLLLGWWVLSQLQASGLMLVVVQSMAVLGAAAYAALRLKQPIIINRSSFSWAEMKPILRYGLPLSLVSSGSWLMGGASRVVLGILAGSAAVGVFASAVQLTLQVMQLALYPLQLAAETVSFRVFEREGPQAARSYLSYYSGMLLFISTGVALTLFLLRAQIVDALLAPEYAGAATLLAFIAPAIALMQLHPSLARSFEFSKHTASLSKYTLGVGVLNVCANLLLVPVLREAGSAIATCVTYITYVSLTYLGGRKHFAWPLPLRSMLALMLPVGVLVSLHQVMGSLRIVPAGFWQTLMAAVGYVLAFAAVSFLALLLGGQLLREQLLFIRQVFSAKDASC